AESLGFRGQLTLDFPGNDLEMESLHKSAFPCNFTIGHPKTLKDVHFYHSINYSAFLFLASTVISPYSS
ncbi:hypothetical protein, partial [Bacteroides uniformis]|uniref:hypothetical protein n=1 Tax=Bacteroides uniformis TaxID=820 RepID=UPI0022E5C125